MWNFRGGGSAHEVEPDHCLLAGVDFRGADLDRQIEVELPHDRGPFRDRGCTESLPAMVLDSKVTERIGGGETEFRNK